MSECSSELSRGTLRAKPVSGGTMKCSRCSNNRLPGNSYCRPCKNKYQRSWSAARNEELKSLRASKQASDNTAHIRVIAGNGKERA